VGCSGAWSRARDGGERVDVESAGVQNATAGRRSEQTKRADEAGRSKQFDGVPEDDARVCEEKRGEAGEKPAERRRAAQRRGRGTRTGSVVQAKETQHTSNAGRPAAETRRRRETGGPCERGGLLGVAQEPVDSWRASRRPAMLRA
jgi:hypothetical protein